MSEEREESPAEDRGAASGHPEPVSTGEPALPAPRRSDAARRTVARLALLLTTVLLVIVIAGVALSPFWAPAVAPLLPWGARPVAASKEFAALSARVSALGQRPAVPAVDADAIKSVASVQSAQATLAQRVDALEADVDRLRQDQATAAATKQALGQLEQRLVARDAQSAARSAADAADIRKNQQDLARLDGLAADLGDRLTAVERQVHAQAGADHSSAMLLLALLQMREAVEESRPFQPEYEVFKALAHDDPKLVAGAQPLAGAARDGLASRAVLLRRLDDLAGQVATASRPAAPSTWWAQVLERLRGLVTIRRIDGAAKTGPQAAIGGAQSALARGDLAGAVSDLDRLNGTHAEAARAWIEMARERLAAERALAQLQEVLSARLATAPGASATVPAAPPSAPIPAGTAPPQPSSSAPSRAPS